jgi:hypothetical protein
MIVPIILGIAVAMYVLYKARKTEKEIDDGKND